MSKRKPDIPEDTDLPQVADSKECKQLFGGRVLRDYAECGECHFKTVGECC